MMLLLKAQYLIVRMFSLSQELQSRLSAVAMAIKMSSVTSGSGLRIAMEHT